MKKNRNEVVVGMFVIIGFIILTVLVFFVSGVYLFRPGYKFDVVYEYVSILDKGAPVRMAGVRIGEVDGVKLVLDPATGDTKVHVKLFIEKGTEIRENYGFFIRGTHVLSEPHIEVTPKPGNAPAIKPGAIVNGENPVAVETLVQKANDIATRLDNILSSFEGALATDEGRESFKKIVINLGNLTDSLNTLMSGTGQNNKTTIQNIQSSADSLSQILEHMKNGEGTAGQLLMKDDLYKELDAFVKEIKTHPWRLMKKDGGGKFLGIF
ncbi:MAG TPA: MlaD family protein [Verrucomicrobiae bacterium]|jgi:phospholipid/cholesterol/gamma-HCH transport system substrate-binding protein|nr:MlaD family protein [Verrucomicrobiae bacterium]